MAGAFQFFLISVNDGLEGIFNYIFPEFPMLGLVLGAISLLFFAVYWAKSGFAQALKLSIGFFLGSSLLAFIIHKLAILVRSIFNS